jgi:hypothetical protein
MDSIVTRIGSVGGFCKNLLKLGNLFRPKKLGRLSGQNGSEFYASVLGLIHRNGQVT